MATEVYDSDYTLKNQHTSVEERQTNDPVTPRRAFLFIQAVGAPSDGNTITLTNAAGLEKTYEFDGNSSVTGDNIAVDITGNDSDVIYGRLKTAIESNTGHGGTIRCSINTSPSDIGGTAIAVRLTLHQLTAGTVGNKSVSFTVDNLYNNDPPTAFENGVDGIPTLTEAQFLLGTKSTINIRGQSPTSRYEVFLGEEKT